MFSLKPLKLIVQFDKGSIYKVLIGNLFKAKKFIGKLICNDMVFLISGVPINKNIWFIMVLEFHNMSI